MASGASSIGNRNNGRSSNVPCHLTKSACGRDGVERFLARPFDS